MTDPFKPNDGEFNTFVTPNYEQIQTVLDATGIGTWDWDVRSGVILVNSKWAEIAGYTLEELGEVSVGTWLRLIHPEDLARSNRELSECWRGNSDRYELECRFKHKYGHWVWVLVTGKVLESLDSGRPKRMVGTHIDVTERKRDKTRLKQQQQMFEAMSEQGRIGAWEIDLSSNIVIWSAMTREIHEVPVDYLPDLLTAINFYKPGESRDMITRLVHEGIELGKPWNVELKLITAKGRECWVASTGSAEFVRGRCVRLYGSFQDIDTRKKAEAEVLKAKLEAELAARAKSEFLAMMSHEIRTPLNGVLGMLSFLQRSKLDANQARKTEVARNSAESLLGIMNDILEYSKVDAGQFELCAIEFDIRKMLDQTIAKMARTAEKKNLELVLDCVNLDAESVVGDETRIKKVLENLVNNAIKFTSSGGVSIIVESHSTSSECELSIKVIDTGMGIPAERQDNLFQPFLQLDAANSYQFGGTGLSLAISQKLCTAMNGSISGRRLNVGGSEFIVSLTLELGRPFQSQATVAEGMRVLIIEKNTSLTEMLERQLTCWGADINVFSDSEALSRYSSANTSIKPYSLVFVHADLNDGSAEAFTNISKNTSYLATAALILIANSAEAIDKPRLLRLGYAMHIARPVSSLDIGRLFEYLQSHQYHNSTRSKLTVAPDKFKQKILLVEDNLVNQEVALMMLNEIGLNADVVEDGEQALQALRAAESYAPYTFIVMDCQMPVMDGYEATRQIRIGNAGKRYINIPIAAMTANAMKGDREKCMDAGMSDYLSKPFDEVDLKALVERWDVRQG